MSVLPPKSFWEAQRKKIMLPYTKRWLHFWSCKGIYIGIMAANGNLLHAHVEQILTLEVIYKCVNHPKASSPLGDKTIFPCFSFFLCFLVQNHFINHISYLMEVLNTNKNMLQFATLRYFSCQPETLNVYSPYDTPTGPSGDKANFPCFSFSLCFCSYWSVLLLNCNLP